MRTHPSTFVLRYNQKARWLVRSCWPPFMLVTANLMENETYRSSNRSATNQRFIEFTIPEQRIS